MHLFRSLRDRFRPQPPSVRPFGLTEADVKKLASLTRHEGYDVWLKALDALCILHGDVLLASSDAYHDTLHKGTLIGIRRAAALVDEILLKEKEIAERTRRREDAHRIDPAARAAALYGSPAWRARSRE